MTKYIGIDLGGTKIAIIAFDDTAEKVIARKVVETHGSEGADGTIRQIIDLVRDIAQLSHSITISPPSQNTAPANNFQTSQLTTAYPKATCWAAKGKLKAMVRGTEIVRPEISGAN